MEEQGKTENEIKIIEKEYNVKKFKTNIKKLKGITSLSLLIMAVPLTETVISCSKGWNPFKYNKIYLTATTTTTVGKTGTIKTEKEYTTEKQQELLSEVYYYGKWELTDQHEYIRDLYLYKLKSDESTTNNILKLISQENMTPEIIEDSLHVASTIRKEWRPKISNEELDREPYIEAKIRSKKMSDTQSILENSDEHFKTLMPKIYLMIILMIIELTIVVKTETVDKIINDILAASEYKDLAALKEELEKLKQEKKLIKK